MTEKIAGNRGHFDRSPFVPTQIDRIRTLESLNIVADPVRTQRIIQCGGRGARIDPQFFWGNRNVGAFEVSTDFLPPNTSLLITAKGWDPAIKDRLRVSTVGGASRGSATYAAKNPIEGVLGFVTLTPLNGVRPISADSINDNKVVTSPIVQPRAGSVIDNTFYLVAEDNVYAIDPTGNSVQIHNELIGTAHDLSFSGHKMAIAASDTDQILILNRSSGDVMQVINMVDHGYHLSIGNLTDIDQNGFYIFPD